MNKRGKSSHKISGAYFLPVILLLYLFISFMAPAIAAEAVLKSSKMIIRVLPVLMIVIILLALFNYLYHTRPVSNYFEKASGLRAWVIAVSGGLLSHGPSYVWYPILSRLRDTGVGDGLIVTFLYVRAIKLPLIPLLVDYFGWRFAAVLTLYLVVAAIVQGVLVDLFQRRTSS